MESEYTKQTCSCELCHPNWHLGEHGDFEVEPVADLAKMHIVKTARTGLTPVFVPLSEVALN